MAIAEERRNSLIGGAVIVALVVFTALVHVNSAHQRAKGYLVTARFHKAEGVAYGTEVRLSGVVVGKIVDQTLDNQFRAVLTLQLADGVKLPTDSNAAIQTDGLLGAKFVSLQPGGDEKDLKPGDEIAYTQDSLAVGDLLDMIISQAESVHGGAEK